MAARIDDTEIIVNFVTPSVTRAGFGVANILGGPGLYHALTLGTGSAAIRWLSRERADIQYAGVEHALGAVGTSYIDLNLGASRSGSAPTGLKNDSTVYGAIIDGQEVDIVGSEAQTITLLVEKINADLSGYTASHSAGEDRIRITKDSLPAKSIPASDGPGNRLAASIGRSSVEIDLGAARNGTDATGLANDTTPYTMTIAGQAISVVGQEAQTLAELVIEINADLSGYTISHSDGNDYARIDPDGPGAVPPIEATDGTPNGIVASIFSGAASIGDSVTTATASLDDPISVKGWFGTPVDGSAPLSAALTGSGAASDPHRITVSLANDGINITTRARDIAGLIPTISGIDALFRASAVAPPGEGTVRVEALTDLEPVERHLIIMGSDDLEFYGFTAEDPEYSMARALFGGLRRPELAHVHVREQGQSLAEALDAAVEASSEWYLSLITERSRQAANEHDDWLLDQELKIGLSACGDELLRSDELSGQRIAVIEHDALADSDPLRRYPDAAWAGMMLPLDPGAATWNLADVSPTQIGNSYGSARLAAIIAARFNVAASERGGVRMHYGTLANGRYIDVRRSVDWIIVQLKDAAFNLRASNAALGLKVPYDVSGFGQYLAVFQGVMRDASARGIVARVNPESDEDRAESDDGVYQYKISVPDARGQIPQEDITNRKLSGIVISLVIAGAVHREKITLNIKE